MAWTDPVRYPNSAEIADNEAFLNTNVIDNLVYLKANAAPFSVFTNEAARDAAITSPTEGMIAYLTASTVAAATGQTTAVPTGIQTIYNGSVWVCVTPVGAGSNTNATTTSTSFVTTLTGDATAISATLVTGTTVRIDLTIRGVNNNNYIYGEPSVSGATTIAASDADCLIHYWFGTAAGITFSKSYILTGLTAGTNTFTFNYKTNAGTASFESRNLIVTGIA